MWGSNSQLEINSHTLHPQGQPGTRTCSVFSKLKLYWLKQQQKKIFIWEFSIPDESRGKIFLLELLMVILVFDMACTVNAVFDIWYGVICVTSCAVCLNFPNFFLMV